MALALRASTPSEFVGNVRNVVETQGFMLKPDEKLAEAKAAVEKLPE